MQGPTLLAEACDSAHASLARLPAFRFAVAASTHTLIQTTYDFAPFASGCSACGKKELLGGAERMEQYFKTRASVDDDPDLARNRRANDARLKSRFEHIFTKYGKDFEGVGDEIDLETGLIVVNNGHIARMQHEVDPGHGASAQVLRVLGGNRQGDGEDIAHGEELVIEDSATDMEDDDEQGATGTSGRYSSDNDDNDEDEGLPNTWAGAQDELSSDFYPVEDATPINMHRPSNPSFTQSSAGQRQERHVHNDPVLNLPHETSSNRSPEDPPMELPFLRDTAKAMQVLPSQHGSVDQDMIQALGQSIANQLAKFMTGGSKKSRRRSPAPPVIKDTRWEYPVLPGDRIDRTPSPSLPESASAALFAASPGREASVWAPQQRRRRRQAKLQSQVSRNTAVNDADSVGDDFDPLQSDPPSYITTTIGEEAEGILDIDCYNCGTTNSRVWRSGPEGRLCDSCGTYYRRYGLMKAIEDPSFTPAPRTGQGRSGVHGRHHASNQDTDIFAIPSTDAPDVTASYAANTARRVTGEGRNGRFTLEEEESIIRLHEVDQLSWDHIGYLLSLRSAYSVHSHYQKFLKVPGCEARRRTLEPRVPLRPSEIEAVGLVQQLGVAEPEDAHSYDIAGFTEREDELIVRLREDAGMTWEQITSYVPNRTSCALQAHYDEHLVGIGSPSSLPGLDDHALHVQPTQQINNHCSASSVPVQSSHSLPGVRRTANADTSAFEHDTFDASITEITSSILVPLTPEEDALMLRLRDEKAMPFRDMTELFKDRTEEALVDRYIQLKARLSNPGFGSISTTSGTSNTVDSTISNIQVGLQPSSNQPGPSRDARTRMPPLRVPYKQAVVSSPVVATSSRQHYAASAVGDRAQFLHTPAVHVRQVSVPPRPAEIGPSAWATTQPASKGPLPFQPARKGLVPIHPKTSSRGLHDPFISRTVASGSLTPHPNVHNEHDTTRETPKSRSRSAKASTRNRTIEVNSQHEVAPEEAQNAMQQSRELPTPAPPFSSEQDDFIKKAREKRKLTWAEIAGTLPGQVKHTPSGITHRYYDHLLGRKSVNKAPMPQKVRARCGEEKAHGEEESAQAARLREQGMSWTEMPDQLPGDTPVSVQDCNYDSIPQVAHKQVTSKEAHPSKPLLRRALKNSTRRTSDVANASMPPESHVQGPPQSLIEQNPEVGSSDRSSSRSGLHEPRPHSHPEVVIRNGECDDLNETSSKLAAIKNPKKPRSKVQSKPKLDTPTSNSTKILVDTDQSRDQAEVTPLPDDAPSDDQVEPHATDLLVGSKDSSPADKDDRVQDAVVSPVHEPQRTKKASSSGMKRKRRTGRAERVSNSEVADSDSDSPLCQDQANKTDDTAHTTPATKRGRGRPKGYAPLPSGAFSLPGLEQVQTANLPEPVTPTVRSGLARPAVEKGTGSVMENAPHSVPGTNATKESTMVAQESTDHQSGNQDGQELRFHTWAEIMLAAFRSHPGAALRPKDIADWIREHSAYYRHATDPWIHHLYNEAYRNPAFEKAQPRARGSAWVLIESKIQPAETQHVGVDVGSNDNAGPNERPASADHTGDDASTKEHIDSSARSTSVQHEDDAGKQDHSDSSVRPSSPEHADDNLDNQERGEPNSQPASAALAEHSDEDIVMETHIDSSTCSTSAEPLNDDDLGPSELLINDDHTGDPPTPASPILQPTGKSAYIVEVIDISSDSPIKQEPTSESRISTSHTHQSNKRLRTEQERSPRVKHIRHSDPALIRRTSALATPARSGSTLGRVGLPAQSTMAVKFEPLFGAEARASPATRVGTSGRRIVLATDVAKDDRAERAEWDELS